MIHCLIQTYCLMRKKIHLSLLYRLKCKDNPVVSSMAFVDVIATLLAARKCLVVPICQVSSAFLHRSMFRYWTYHSDERTGRDSWSTLQRLSTFVLSTTETTFPSVLWNVLWSRRCARRCYVCNKAFGCVCIPYLWLIAEPVLNSYTTWYFVASASLTIGVPQSEHELSPL